MNKLISLFILLSCVTYQALAGDKVAIINGRILVTETGQDIDNGTIIIANGKIEKLGRDIDIPAGSLVIDAAGKVITPGFIATDTTLGITEINGRANASDDRSLTSKVTAGFDVRDAINPHSSLLSIAMLGGITQAIVSPQTNSSLGQPFTGQSARLDVGISHSVWQYSPAAVVMDYKSFAKKVGRGAAWILIEQLLSKAQKQSGDSQDANMNALSSLFDEQRVLLIRADKAMDLQRIVRLKEQWKLNIVIQGAAEGWMVAKLLSAAEIPVILDTDASLPLDFDKLNTRLDNAALLSDSGVKVIIRADKDGHFARNGRIYAGMAVANGLAFDEALKALTLYPAQVFGLTDVGTIAEGNRADLVIWTADPLEPLSQISNIFIAGQEQALSSRHLMLRDRYL